LQVGIKNNIALWFSIKFIVLFLSFYYFNILFFGLTSPGNSYSAFLDDHLNYIDWLRWILLHTSCAILNLFGFTCITSANQLLVAGHGVIDLIYTCLGLGVMSFFAAFVIAYPKKIKAKLLFLTAGLLSIQILNIIRLMLLALYWNKNRARIIDHHVIFDVIIYIVIIVALYKWVNNKATNPHAAN
jgi:exosortase/archaeosortase family protein